MGEVRSSALWLVGPGPQVAGDSEGPRGADLLVGEAVYLHRKLLGLGHLRIGANRLVGRARFHH